MKIHRPDDHSAVFFVFGATYTGNAYHDAAYAAALV
jgi:hypothetical protein